MADQQLLAAKTRDAALAAIAGGANVNVKDAQGTPAVVLAVKKELPRVFAVLLEKGADMNAKDAAGRTAMMFIPGVEAEATREKMILAIASAEPNLDVNAVDNEGKSTLTYVMDAFNPEEDLIKYLLERDVIVSENDITLARENYPEYAPNLEAKKLRQDRAPPGGRRRKTRKTRARRRRTMRR